MPNVQAINPFESSGAAEAKIWAGRTPPVGNMDGFLTTIPAACATEQLMSTASAEYADSFVLAVILILITSSRI